MTDASCPCREASCDWCYFRRHRAWVVLYSPETRQVAVRRVKDPTTLVYPLEGPEDECEAAEVLREASQLLDALRLAEQ